MPDYPDDLTGRPWTDDLSAVNIGEGVTHIGANAFSGCAQLDEISIPASVGSIGEYAFRDTSIDSAVLPDTEITVGVGAFDGHVRVSAGEWVYRISEAGATVCAWNGSDDNLVVPAFINGLQITEIAAQAFANNDCGIRQLD